MNILARPADVCQLCIASGTFRCCLKNCSSAIRASCFIACHHSRGEGGCLLDDEKEEPMAEPLCKSMAKCDTEKVGVWACIGWRFYLLAIKLVGFKSTIWLISCLFLWLGKLTSTDWVLLSGAIGGLNVWQKVVTQEPQQESIP